MCGIIGFFSETKDKKEIAMLKKVVMETKIRGLHSFGTAYFKNGKIKIKKEFELNFDKLFGKFINSNSKRIIFHCRYSTSGDYHKHKNNQPIKVGKVAIAMNGIISMERKKKYEKQFNVECKSGNDAEIILRKDMKYLEFLNEYNYVSFAGVFLKKNKIVGLRNNKRPMYKFKYRESKFIVSTADIAVRSGIDNVKIVKPFKLVRI